MINKQPYYENYKTCLLKLKGFLKTFNLYSSLISLVISSVTTCIYDARWRWAVRLPTVTHYVRGCPLLTWNFIFPSTQSCLADWLITDGTLAGHRSQTVANTKTEQRRWGSFILKNDQCKRSGVNQSPSAGMSWFLLRLHSPFVTQLPWKKSERDVRLPFLKCTQASCSACMLCFIDTLLESYLGSSWSLGAQLKSAYSW